ncbi:MAG: hypothetical protein FWE31_01170 [Firmicutes bacterium]|nr:hypothetical protein [Bacillota bacterium]
MPSKFGYHLTEKKNLFGDDGIAQAGLIPKLGGRSQSVNDDRKAIFISSMLKAIVVWRERLFGSYRDRNRSPFHQLEFRPLEELVLLRINCENHNLVETPLSRLPEFTYEQNISPQDIEIVTEIEIPRLGVITIGKESSNTDAMEIVFDDMYLLSEEEWEKVILRTSPVTSVLENVKMDDKEKD